MFFLHGGSFVQLPCIFLRLLPLWVYAVVCKVGGYVVNSTAFADITACSVESQELEMFLNQRFIYNLILMQALLQA